MKTDNNQITDRVLFNINTNNFKNTTEGNRHYYNTENRPLFSETPIRTENPLELSRDNSIRDEQYESVTFKHKSSPSYQEMLTIKKELERVENPVQSNADQFKSNFDRISRENEEIERKLLTLKTARAIVTTREKEKVPVDFTLLQSDVISLKDENQRLFDLVERYETEIAFQRVKK